MPSTADDVAAIRRLSGDWLAAFHAHDVPRMLTMITEDAVFMAPGMADVRGKPAAEGLYRRLFAQFASVEQQVAIEEIVVSRDWAFARGHEHVTLRPLAGGTAIELKGKGMSVFKREAGGWKFARAINNVVPFTPAPR